MLELSLIVIFIVGIAAMALSRQVRTSALLTGIAVLFLPFGVLVGIGWLLPKALQLIIPYISLKDVI